MPDMAAVMVTVFGALSSTLLGVLVWIAKDTAREMREVGKKVDGHGEQLAAIHATLAHMTERPERRQGRGGRP